MLHTISYREYTGTSSKQSHILELSPNSRIALRPIATFSVLSLENYPEQQGEGNMYWPYYLDASSSPSNYIHRESGYENAA